MAEGVSYPEVNERLLSMGSYPLRSRRAPKVSKVAKQLPNNCRNVAPGSESRLTLAILGQILVDVWAELAKHIGQVWPM